MQTFTYYLTLQVSGMNDESVENKLDKFLASLELKVCGYCSNFLR